jgi:hypothetical protein
VEKEKRNCVAGMCTVAGLRFETNRHLNISFIYNNEEGIGRNENLFKEDCFVS